MTTATDMLAKYLAAESAVLDGKEVTWGDRKLRSEDLPEIRAGRQEWEIKVEQENRATSGRKSSIGGARFSVANLS